LIAPSPTSNGSTDTAARSLDLSSGAENGDRVPHDDGLLDDGAEYGLLEHGGSSGGTEDDDGTVDSNIGAMDSDAQDDDVDHGGVLKDGADDVYDDDDGEEDDIDPNAAALDEMDLEWSKDVLPSTSLNMAIAYLYIHVHHAADPKEWGKPGGVMTQIKNTLDIDDPDTSIEAVLWQVWTCPQNGVVYNGGETTPLLVDQKRGPK
jgi:hypothetical protein